MSSFNGQYTYSHPNAGDPAYQAKAAEKTRLQNALRDGDITMDEYRTQAANRRSSGVNGSWREAIARGEYSNKRQNRARGRRGGQRGGQRQGGRRMAGQAINNLQVQQMGQSPATQTAAPSQAPGQSNQSQFGYDFKPSESSLYTPPAMDGYSSYQSGMASSPGADGNGNGLIGAGGYDQQVQREAAGGSVGAINGSTNGQNIAAFADISRLRNLPKSL